MWRGGVQVGPMKFCHKFRVDGRHRGVWKKKVWTEFVKKVGILWICWMMYLLHMIPNVSVLMMTQYCLKFRSTRDGSMQYQLWQYTLLGCQASAHVYFFWNPCWAKWTSLGVWIKRKWKFYRSHYLSQFSEIIHSNYISNTTLGPQNHKKLRF